MLYIKNAAVTVLAFSALAVWAGARIPEVKVSSFGFDPDDSTVSIQKALDSGAARIVFDKQNAPWVTKPLFVRSDTEIVFEEGVELVAKRGEFSGVYDALMTLDSVTNVSIRALGKGAVFRMWKTDYQKPPYKRAEWRHTLCIMSSDNVSVGNLVLRSSGGDGIYLGSDKHGFTNTRITIRDCVCDDHHRQGISVITANGLLIERTAMKNTKGTPPESGIDFEPNGSFQELGNIVLRDCVTENNAGAGYDFFLANMTRESKPVTVTLERCKSIGDRRSPFPLNLEPGKRKKGSPHGGFIRVIGCEFRDSPSPAVMISDKPLGVMDVLFENCIFDNCPKGRSGVSNVRLASTRLDYPPTDGVTFRNVTIRRSKGEDWFGRPGFTFAGNVRAVGGDVTLIEDGTVRKESLDKAWFKEHFPEVPQDAAKNIVAFDPSGAEAVDNAPGKTVKLNRLNLRGRFAALVYAERPGPVEVGVLLRKINERKLGDRLLVVTDMNGGKVAELKVVMGKEEKHSFNAPARGFYRIMCDIGPHILVYTSSNVPLGILSLEPGGLDVFKSSGKIHFHHRKGERITFIGCGGGVECVTERVFDPAGNMVAEWRNSGGWECVPIAEGGPDGLWTVEIAPANKGYGWEDSYLDLRGAAPVFFLTDEKYWK